MMDDHTPTASQAARALACRDKFAAELAAVQRAGATPNEAVAAMMTASFELACELVGEIEAIEWLRRVMDGHERELIGRAGVAGWQSPNS